MATKQLSTIPTRTEGAEGLRPLTLFCILHGEGNLRLFPPTFCVGRVIFVMFTDNITVLSYSLVLRGVFYYTYIMLRLTLAAFLSLYVVIVFIIY
jgi:hypothetical protein